MGSRKAVLITSSCLLVLALCGGRSDASAVKGKPCYDPVKTPQNPGLSGIKGIPNLPPCDSLQDSKHLPSSISGNSGSVTSYPGAASPNSSILSSNSNVTPQNTSNTSGVLTQGNSISGVLTQSNSSTTGSALQLGSNSTSGVLTQGNNSTTGSGLQMGNSSTSGVLTQGNSSTTGSAFQSGNSSTSGVLTQGNSSTSGGTLQQGSGFSPGSMTQKTSNSTSGVAVVYLATSGPEESVVKVPTPSDDSVESLVFILAEQSNVPSADDDSMPDGGCGSNSDATSGEVPQQGCDSTSGSKGPVKTRPLGIKGLLFPQPCRPTQGDGSSSDSKGSSVSKDGTLFPLCGDSQDPQQDSDSTLDSFNVKNPGSVSRN
ncbi:P17/29C-like protein DDB_G0287399 isoform X2 [Microcaecilia unicolor]|uniref:P17/29C-like protein DDB_G0287399 isoform X2 n=1 Tax=Microcaecilia unicolor TaxID=1415580 RepID=A0A6P7XRF9_9AMPH|nr:P17/29C-like protein DDB_G0287399 isoform X2 [Microcaecilia unicolor]